MSRSSCTTGVSSTISAQALGSPRTCVLSSGGNAWPKTNLSLTGIIDYSVLAAVQSALQALLARRVIVATLTIRNLDDELKSRLRVRAARHDHSMEEEARSILRSVLSDSQEVEASTGIGTRIRNRLKNVGGIELNLPPRTETPRVPENLE
ncbi:MAG: FitA-like ribbon-helix-helix domain-containing protein [Spirochaetales bacterium]